LEPNLGVVDMGEGNSFVLADIPGIIEGAHEGIGLGHQFLKHIERTRLIIHVIDMSGSEGRDPYSDYLIINSELEKYNLNLASRPQIIAANKMDITGSEENLEIFSKMVRETNGNENVEIFPISAATNKGIKELLRRAYTVLKELPPIPLYNPEDSVLYKAEEELPFDIDIDEEGKYVVTGKWVRKLVNSTNFEDYESLQHFQMSMKRKGIVDALVEKGIQEGDTVQMFDVEFEYIK
jgi:GTP-binding protein